MTNTITPEERKVAYRFGMTEQQYLEKRAKYAASQGKTFESLASLSAQELNVMNAMGVEADAFHSNKLAILAEKVINQL
ncbi:hypothetical protein [Nitrincola sp.]|uniref:hypothetical protein n=1 Tax=Nitrincola sp. TaxID=1926584 RepID=UPI003A919EB0